MIPMLDDNQFLGNLFFTILFFCAFYFHLGFFPRLKWVAKNKLLQNINFESFKNEHHTNNLMKVFTFYYPDMLFEYGGKIYLEIGNQDRIEVTYTVLPVEALVSKDKNSYVDINIPGEY